MVKVYNYLCNYSSNINKNATLGYLFLIFVINTVVL
jgi:hypothetical protein